MNITTQPHALLPEYKATNSSRYHIAQRVETDTGMTIWREIATFNDSARRDEVLQACNSHQALVDALSFMLSMHDGTHGLDGHGQVSGLTNARAALHDATQ